MTDFNTLFAAAAGARAKAYAPYSRFPVGAVMVDETGALHAGCNIENAAYPQGWCAETTAIGHLIMAGGKRIVKALVIAERIDHAGTPGGRFCTPCGGCRQKLAEFAGPDAIIIACDPAGASQSFTMAELLPAGFCLEIAP
jgi:cytidine deaminase